MNKIMIVATAATALCFPAGAQQQSGTPLGGSPTQAQSRDQQEMQSIINEEKQELAEGQVAPNVPIETTGQGSRPAGALQQSASSVGESQTQTQSANGQQEIPRIINEEKQELAEDQVAPNVPLETTGQGPRTQ